jgi:hypothetical protein
MNQAPNEKGGAEVYRKAALLIERGEACRSCWAVSMAVDYRDDSFKRRYVEAMLGGDECTAQLFYDIPGGGNGKLSDDIRVVSLCFMAAMAETGDA